MASMQLKALYPTLSADARKALAEKAGIKPAYLWQISTGWDGRKPSISLMARLAKADKRLKVADLVEEFSEAKAA